MSSSYSPAENRFSTGRLSPEFGAIERSFVWAESNNAYRQGISFLSRGLFDRPNMTMDMGSYTLARWLERWGNAAAASFETPFRTLETTWGHLSVPTRTTNVPIGADNRSEPRPPNEPLSR